MNNHLAKALDQAKQFKAENTKFLRGLKRKPGKRVDEMFHSTHEEVFQEVDCLDCANCCKTTSPIFRDIDIKRISKHLKMKSADFETTYLRLDDEGDYVLKSAPCAFLGADNTCEIYEVRPKACAEYPHTDRKNMQQILGLTQHNTLVCPAVAEIVKRIKEGV